MTNNIEFELSNSVLVVIIIVSLILNIIMGGMIYYNVDKFGVGSQFDRTERVWGLMHNYTEFEYLSNDNYKISTNQTFEQMISICHGHDKHCKFAIDISTQYICDGGGPLLDFLN